VNLTLFNTPNPTCKPGQLLSRATRPIQSPPRPSYIPAHTLLETLAVVFLPSLRSTDLLHRRGPNTEVCRRSKVCLCLLPSSFILFGSSSTDALSLPVCITEFALQHALTYQQYDTPAPNLNPLLTHEQAKGMTENQGWPDVDLKAWIRSCSKQMGLVGVGDG
jgi:hypothetical protein